MARHLLSALAAFLALTGTAHAVTLVTPDGVQRPQPYQRWVDSSDVPAPPALVEISSEPFEGLRPVAVDWHDGTYSIRFSLTDFYALPQRQVFYHELGHIRQYVYGLPETEFDADRYARCAIRGVKRHRRVCQRYLRSPAPSLDAERH